MFVSGERSCSDELIFHVGRSTDRQAKDSSLYVTPKRTASLIMYVCM